MFIFLTKEMGKKKAEHDKKNQQQTEQMEEE